MKSSASELGLTVEINLHFQIQLRLIVNGVFLEYLWLIPNLRRVLSWRAKVRARK